MSGTWPVWIALVVLTLSHVGMFALGVVAYHCLRWINTRQIMPRPQMSEAKLAQMADKIARQQLNAQQFAYFQNNQQVQRPSMEEVEESFAPTPRK